MLRLTAERQKQGLTKSALSRLTGINLPALVNLEAGRLHPYPKMKREIAEALGVADPDSLFQEVDDGTAEA